ncbi:MAG: amino acid--tRNA ligase-related protein, partial [Nocardioides sp.]|uniref:amino acid--tRNA ligase-related protein n=1 Tax=Nocardioides sp. TaxID=35761 RepID=UPI0032667C28
AKPFVTHHNALDQQMFLRIAPELYLKRLVVGGFERVFEINRSFRNEGISVRHNPEFTMMEFYAAYWDHHDLMDYTEQVLRHAARCATGSALLSYAGRPVDLDQRFTRMTVREALVAHAGMSEAEAIDAGALHAKLRSLGHEPPAHWTLAELQFLLAVGRGHHLGVHVLHIARRERDPGLWRELAVGEHPGRLLVGPRLAGVGVVIEDPLVGRGAHADGADVLDEVAVVERTGLVLVLHEEPVERVVLVCDVAVERGRAVEDRLHFSFLFLSQVMGSPWSISCPDARSIRRTSWRRCAPNVSTCASTLPIWKLSGGSQSASINRSSQALRRSTSRTTSSQRGAIASCRALSEAGSSPPFVGKSAPSKVAVQTSLLQMCPSSTAAADGSVPSHDSTVWPGSTSRR